MTYQLPSNLFKSVDDVQIYTHDWIQREIIHNPDILCIDLVAKYSNVDYIE